MKRTLGLILALTLAGAFAAPSQAAQKGRTQTTAVALEGWAFDADRSAEAAARAVAADPAAVRVLRPIVESALHAASKSQTTRRTK
jgi:hypothetical protein